MTPYELKMRRLELGLTLEEMAFALNVTEAELRRIESGESRAHETPAFGEALDRLEECLLGTFVGA
jgi:transcriptional regulator with XRE-family HTH domain